MANVTIADLPSASTATLADQFEVNQGGVSKKVTGQLIADLVEGQLGTIATQNFTNVTITGGSVTGITDLAIADGGTGSSTAQGARNNLLPSQTGNANKFLKTDGTNVSWDNTGITDGDKGDITVTSSGATWTIDSNAITTTKIADSNVTGSKLENSGVTAGTYGSGTSVPVVTIDAKGRVTSASSQSITVYPGKGTEVFGSSTNWTPPTGVTKAVITVIGGGGGARTSTGAAAGGSGGIAIAYCTGLSGSISITIGAGGNGASAANASAGGTSSVSGTGVSISATGGGGATSGTTGTSGTGSVSTGTALKTGSQWQSGSTSTATSTISSTLPSILSGINGAGVATAVAWSPSGDRNAGMGGSTGALIGSGGIGGAVIIEY